ncbi:MAG: molybdopterin oxidoreductase [Planctomycetota bacterium]|nr:MAG: molybdopterin oxidoreductase [Planctomycetota bacterium]
MIENEKETSEELNYSSYWDSFAAYYDNPEEAQIAMEEIIAEAPLEDKPGLGRINRRHFLALMGTSAALAGAGCNDYYDQGEIVPYNKKPVDHTPGVADFYASTIAEGGEAHSVFIKVREGRPIKIDGNPNHPVSKGKVNARVQATIMDFYDPERIKSPLKGDVPIGWSSVDNAIAVALKNLKGDKTKSLAIVTHSILSPTTDKFLKDLEEKYNAKIYSYELTGSMVRDEAWDLCYGEKKAPIIDWSKPNVIVALESDFLGADGNTTESTRKFTSRRSALSKSPVKDFNKLYSIEGQTSATGMNADFRYRLDPAKQLDFCFNLILKLKDSFKFEDAVLLKAAKAEKIKIEDRLVNDLKKLKGNSLIYAGEKLPLSVHVLVNYINEVLGNQSVYEQNAKPFVFRPVQTVNGLKSLIADMNAGKIGVVVHYDTNPAYHLPKEFNYIKALKNVDVSLSLTEFVNETSVKSTYTLPIHHSLESWGDYFTREGVYNFQQPVINPMHGTRQKEGILISWLTGNKYTHSSYRQFIKVFALKEVYPKFGSAVDFNVFWKAALKEGFVSFNVGAPKLKSFDISALKKIQATKSTGYTLLLANNARLGDGRNIGNGWLQELPHTISKVVWDNYAAMSLKLANKLGCRTFVPSFDKNYDMITLTVEGNSLTLPVLVQPGMDDNTIMVELGFGRTECTTIGKGEDKKRPVIGFNANELLNSKNLTPWLYTGVKATKGSGTYKLVATQEMYSMEGKPVNDGFLSDALQSMPFIGKDFLSKDIVGMAEKRDIIQEVTVENNKLKHGHPVFSINDSMPYPGYKWAMAIDLNRCTGCNDCIVSCSAENNVPVVGKAEVGKGREMHWIRIDRYFLGTKSTNDNPKVAFQPMLCQHCDNAPCENVCPVVATSHSKEGLNDMAYNRCVGTRYCANNCPYKVRRFNYFNFRNNLGRKKWNGLGHYEKKPSDLLHNPEVTVRSRGVMEKCSFCVQQILEAKQKAKEQGRGVVDGDVVTACQQACPSTAISFGNINDQKSEIRKWSNSHLNYKVLDTINVRPNVNYLAKMRFEDKSSKSKEKSNMKNGEKKHH